MKNICELVNVCIQFSKLGVNPGLPRTPRITLYSPDYLGLPGYLVYFLVYLVLPGLPCTPPGLPFKPRITLYSPDYLVHTPQIT